MITKTGDSQLTLSLSFEPVQLDPVNSKSQGERKIVRIDGGSN